jgi:hypothetical protein
MARFPYRLVNDSNKQIIRRQRRLRFSIAKKDKPNGNIPNPPKLDQCAEPNIWVPHMDDQSLGDSATI